MDLQRAAASLGGEVQGNRILAPTPGHSHRDRGLCITFDPSYPDGFIVKSFNGGDDWREYKDYVKSTLGISSDHTFERHEPIRRSKPRQDNKGMAYDIWKASLPIRGTPVDAYLKSRGLNIGQEMAGVLKYHANCPFKGEKVKAMVAPMVNVLDGTFQGVHRTRLNPKDKAMLGPAKDAVVKLTPDDEVTTGLHICEGIETGLALVTKGLVPLWVCLSANGIAELPVLGGIECLTIFADNDASRAGETAAIKCAARWQAAGREVNIIMTPDEGTDFADWRAK